MQSYSSIFSKLVSNVIHYIITKPFHAFAVVTMALPAVMASSKELPVYGSENIFTPNFDLTNLNKGNYVLYSNVPFNSASFVIFAIGDKVSRDYVLTNILIDTVVRPFDTFYFPGSEKNCTEYNKPLDSLYCFDGHYCSTVARFDYQVAECKSLDSKKNQAYAKNVELNNALAEKVKSLVLTSNKIADVALQVMPEMKISVYAGFQKISELLENLKEFNEKNFLPNAKKYNDEINARVQDVNKVLKYSEPQTELEYTRLATKIIKLFNDMQSEIKKEHERAIQKITELDKFFKTAQATTDSSKSIANIIKKNAKNNKDANVQAKSIFVGNNAIFFNGKVNPENPFGNLRKNVADELWDKDFALVMYLTK